MVTVIEDFEKRVREIELYYQLLDRIITENATLFFPNKTTHKYKQFDPELVKVMKANVFLLLYNLVESSIKQAIIAICDNITSSNVKYENVADEIKKIWIQTKYKNFRGVETDKIFETIDNIAEDIIEITSDFQKKILGNIAGNIDGRKIRDVADKLGFSSKTHYRTKNGVKLHEVKTQRNKLAHG